MDFASYRSNASGEPTGGHPLDASVKLNVALVLDRANDPTALLQSDWATRQKELATLNDNGTLWTKYGADPAKYAAVHTALASLGIKTLDQLSAETGISNGYVSSAESRTVWVQVDGSSFPTLFGPQAKLMVSGSDGTWFWTNSLAVPEELASLGVSGIWFDTVGKFVEQVADPGTGHGVTLPPHWQSVGNASTDGPSLFPQEIGSYYRLPLGSDVPTGTIGLIEPGVGTALPGDDSGSHFQKALDIYRQQAGVPTGAPAMSVAGGGQKYPVVVPGQNNAAGERSLDVGVVSTVAPNSPLVLYAGSGTNLSAEHGPFTVYQSAFWDLVNNPQVIGASPDITEHVAPGSPFFKASTELFVDAALRNIMVFNAIGDGGSGGEYANGLTNISSSRSLGYSVMVGGTSLSTSAATSEDVTLKSIVEMARAGNRDVIWSLVAGGMTESPIGEMDSAAAFIETIWNGYYLEGRELGGPRNPHPHGDYQHNATGAGGVDPSQPVPRYQTEYGLSPVTADPGHLPGRGTPDVSANAGGNMFWHTPGPDMILLSGTRAIGTSASAPFWAGFGAQLNAVFKDQGLPQLGYMTDLLYIASAIATASFNDITIGNNISSFVLGGDFYKSDDVPITPTGYGYHAEVGYDLASGLGSPNGLLLARALTEIGHHQMHFSEIAPLIEGNTADGWTSAAGQTLLIQASIRAGHDASLDLGDHKIALDGGGAGSFAWTPRFAQQSLQPDFDPTLVRMFDKQSQGWVGSRDVASGEGISARIGPSDGVAKQAGLTSPYGLADFSAHDGNIHFARAVAVAETAGGADDQTAIVRLRQNGEDNLSVSFYRVDDLNGAIGTVDPGDAAYAAAAAARLYVLQTGGAEVAGPGYGLFAQAHIVDIDAGDLVAMRLINHSSGQTYFAFTQANGDGAAHLVNYGMNTWGFEDLYGGGDRDFNDFVVQLDFTSASGHGWLA
ncbi:MAG: DUF4114 domain-containing protein [Rhodospirillales bacterium]|nr:DUF4114 domain-containing protein [Rhodospirillales bacterium]